MFVLLSNWGLLSQISDQSMCNNWELATLNVLIDADMESILFMASLSVVTVGIVRVLELRHREA
jgi:hypothetical protein